MEFKRVYEGADLQRYRADKEAALVTARAKAAVLDVSDELKDDIAKKIVEAQNIPLPMIEGLELHHTGTTPEQNFSTDFVTEMLKLGVMELSEKTLTLHATHAEKDAALIYTIKRAPGRYCLHCGEKLEGDEGGQMARLHVAMNHAGAASPDVGNPAGYVWLKHFECALNVKQHSQYQYGGG